MKKNLLTLVLLLIALMAGAAEKKVSSPDGRLNVSVDIDGSGHPTYRVDYDNKAFMLASPLGVNTNMGDFTQGLMLKTSKEQRVTDSYELKTIKQSHVDYEANELVCTYEKDGKPAIDIVFRVSNRDVAYRYKVYEQGKTLSCIVKNEASAFRMPKGTTTFLCPQMRPMTGFARTAPSYETNYMLDQPMEKSRDGMGYTFPCLFKTAADGGWMLVSETGVDGSYCASRLLSSGDGVFSIGFPMPEECNGWGTVEPAVALPAYTPWRTITVGNTLQNIVESTVAYDLVQPKYEASKEYTYGKGTWSWIIGMDGSCNYDEQKRYIDFAAAMGYRSVLIDALWDKQIGYKRMEELARYGKEKGVGIFLWYNSNGAWNDAPQSPKHKMDRSGVRCNEMAWMQRTGILGIKVDFFGGDKQNMMQLYEDILTDANDFGLQVIFHGCTLPRGWERMYPNHVSSEAVLASENLHFSQGMCDNEARNGCIHTFVRNAVGSMDFGGSTLNKFYKADNRSGSRRMTSDVYALATAVLFQSSVQHFAMAPNNLTDAPAWAIDFMKQVPTTWDEVRFIDGYPGRFSIIARRHGDTWYVAGINAQDEAVETIVTLPGNPVRKTVKCYVDNDRLEGSLTDVKTGKKGTVKVRIPKNGGCVITY